MLDFSLPYVPIFIIAGSFSILLAIVIGRQKTVSGSIFLAIDFALVGIWMILAAIEGSASQQATKIFWAKWQYPVTQNILPFLVLFILSYTGRIQRPYSRYARWFYLLWAIPVGIILLALTNEWHHLIWKGFSPIDPSTRLMVYQHGFAYFIMMAFFVIMLLVMLSILWVEMIKAPQRRYRWQMGLMILSIFWPVIGGFIYNSGLNPIPGLDWGSVGMLFTVLMMTISLFGFKFLEIVPVARELLLEQMDVGVLVIDANRRIVDLNLAFQRFFPELHTPLGIDAYPVLTQLGIKGAPFEFDGLVYHQEILSDLANWYCLDFNLRKIYAGKRFIGWLAEFRDISFQKKAIQEKERINEDLNRQLLVIQALQHELKEQAIRDALTNVYNRRYFNEAFEKEIARAKRNGSSITIILIDIDHFKRVNDACGHAAGDRVLKNFGTLLLEKTRGEDIVCRFGGEEFIMLFVNADMDATLRRVNQIREDFHQMCLQDALLHLDVTISSGVAAYPQHGRDSHELFLKVDRALYAAKAAGRNCVVMSTETVTTREEAP